MPDIDIKTDNNGGYLVREKHNTTYTNDRLWLIESIKELKECNKETQDDITSIKQNLSALNVKAGMWGVLGGAIVFAVAYLQSLFKQ